MSLIVRIVRHGASVLFDRLEEDEDRDTTRQKRTTHLGIKGAEQADLTGQRLAKLDLDVAVTSPFFRAKKTLEIIGQHCPVFPNVIEDLREIDRGVDGLSGLDPNVIRYKIWRGRVFSKTHDLNSKFLPEDESYGEFLTRVIRFKNWLPKEFDNQKLLVVGHSQFFALLLTTVVHGDSPNQSVVFSSINRYFMSHCGITEIRWHPRFGWKIVYFNDTSHLKQHPA